MNHKTISQLLSSYADGELKSGDMDWIRRHLESCADCRKSLAQFTEIRREIHSLSAVDLRSSFPSDVMRTIRLRQSDGPASMNEEFTARRILIALSILVLLLAGVASFNRGQSPASLDRYLTGEVTESTESRILLTHDEISKDDILVAAVSKR